MNDDFLLAKLHQREAENSLRQLRLASGSVDFYSNDYLGIATRQLIKIDQRARHGSTGSRLLSGNYKLVEETEDFIAGFHKAPAGLIYNSGYDANVGLLSCIAGRADTIIYDYLSHASIRDGVRLSLAKSFSFQHNDLHDLEKKLKQASGQCFVVTESVFSMDGDFAPLKEILELCDRYTAALIVDEAHATGVIGDGGEGLVQLLELHDKCFARIHTFGKGCGVHGAIVLGSERLKNYLVNFSRAFIYTTSLPEAAILAIRNAYNLFPNMMHERSALKDLIRRFQSISLKLKKIESESAIQAVIVPGNEEVKKCAASLQQRDLDVRAIVYPTVPKGTERLRIVLHAFNTEDQLSLLTQILNEATVGC